MEQHLKYFKVENFKKFSSLEISNIGQFNLIVGDNNTGKTSALEAMTFDDYLPNYLNAIKYLLECRKIEAPSQTDFNYFNLFFHNKQEQSISYSIQYKDNENPKKITYKIGESENFSEDENKILEKRFSQPSKFSIRLMNETKLLDVCFLKGYENLIKKEYIPFIPLNIVDYATGDLVKFYSTSFQSSKSKKQNLIEYLKIFIPDLENLEVTNGIVPNTSTLCIWRTAFDEPFIVNSFGDGTVRTLRILLEIAQCENKFLLLDEIDTGIHYSRIDQFWEVIIKSAQINNVQITATTHSKECLVSFKNVLAKLNKQDDGRVIRFVDQSGQIKTYTYNYEQFDQALEYDNEIR